MAQLPLACLPLFAAKSLATETATPVPPFKDLSPLEPNLLWSHIQLDCAPMLTAIRAASHLRRRRAASTPHAPGESPSSKSPPSASAYRHPLAYRGEQFPSPYVLVNPMPDLLDPETYAALLEDTPPPDAPQRSPEHSLHLKASGSGVKIAQITATGTGTHSAAAEFFSKMEAWLSARDFAALPSNAHVMIADKAVAADWGRPYCIFPVGALQYVWLPRSKYLFQYPEWERDQWWRSDGGFEEYMAGVRTDGLEEALACGHEVLFTCPAFYAVDALLERQLWQHLFRSS